MNKILPKSYNKILGSIMVPVFLFIPITVAFTDIDVQNLNITFQVKNPSENRAVFEDYSLTPKALFQNIFKADVSAENFRLMKNDQRIAYVELDRPVHAFAITTNDSFFTTSDTVDTKQWYLPKTQIPQAWDYSKGANNVIIAIIDTGVHAGHIELSDGRIAEGYNVITEKVIPANSNSDDNGHGTAVAGVIGAIPNNHVGISGINWNIKLMPVKVLSANGAGDTSDVGAGIVWAADHGANIINLSLGGAGYGPDLTLSNAITYAYNKGVLIVAAAGNDLADQGNNLDASPVYPVCGDNSQDMVLGVAATDIADQKASFSNYGVSCIDISAPGKKIITTAYLPSEPSNNILIYGSGTSLAAPIVSGVAALIKSYNNNLSNTDIRNLIKGTAEDIYPFNQTACLGGSCNGFLGKGRINAQSAITPRPNANGSLVREVITGDIYFIAENKKRRVSEFVFNQRGFNLNNVLSEAAGPLSNFPTDKPLPPLEDTLIKGPSDAQVYIINSDLKRPLTYLVFITKGLNFANISILPQNEVNSYSTGEWAEPPEGTMVLIHSDPTVYVMHQKLRWPVTFFVFQQRRLSFAKVIRVTQDEFSHIPAPKDSFWLPPPDATLVKSELAPAIYLIENGTRREISFEAFVGRGFRFGNVKALPKAEIDVIAPGPPLLIP